VERSNVKLDDFRRPANRKKSAGLRRLQRYPQFGFVCGCP
jgi:hypothetical protein